MNRRHRIVLVLFVTLTCIGCDQATKSIASRRLPVNRPIVLVSELIHLQYTENTGAMMGFGAGLSERLRFWLFRVFAGLALSLIFAFTVLETSLNRPDIIALSLVLGGGFGNLLDRLFKDGIVVDFLIVSLGSWKTAIFNFADLSIMSGLVLLTAVRLFGLAKPVRTSSDG